MRPIIIPGGMYSWALPDGQWASLVQRPAADGRGHEFLRIDTDAGVIPLPRPGSAPLYMRPRLDGRKFAGQNWTGDRVLEWDGDVAQWVEHPTVAAGTFPCLYDLQGTLHVVTAANVAVIGVNGYRYVTPDGTPGGRLVTGDATYGPTASAPRLSQHTDVSRFGDTFIVGQGHEVGGVLYYDGRVWRRIGEGICKGLWTWREGGIVAVAYYRELGGYATEAEVWIGTVAEFQALPEVAATLPAPRPIGPTSDPLPEGTEIDLTPFFAYDPAVWPRGGDKSKGDSHLYDYRAVTHRGAPCWWLGLWGPRLGSLIQIRDGMVHLLADCHNRDNTGHPDGPFIDTWSSTDWLALKTRIGRQYGLSRPDHTIRKHREDGTIFKEFGWSKEWWIQTVWPRFWCGPDLGERMVVRVAQNNTGLKPGQTTDIPGLGMESSYLVLGAGQCRWTYDPAMNVFVGPNHAPIFPDKPQASSDFWHVGGPRYTPEIPAWIPLASEVPTTMKLPSDVQATIRAFAAVNPLPQGPADNEAWQDTALRHLPGGWTARLAQQLAFSHGGDWGQKRRGPGTAISAGRIARREAGGFRDWDILIAAASGRPTLNLAEESPGLITDQEFVPVVPFNHLADGKPRPGRAPWPAAARHGVSAFDVAARLHGGDDSYYRLTAPLPLNVFVYATINHPASFRLGRTFTEGLAQTETLLKRLTADGRQAMFVMLCGPALWGGDKLTRSQALDMIRDEVALFLRYPKAVLALSLGNELFQQGFEAPEMLDPTFWAEAEALIPLQFPFAVGQVGETVVFGPGSVAMMHPDRGKGSADALAILAEAQSRDGRTVVAREPARIEAGGSGQSRGDLAFVREELANAKRLNLPYFLHLAAGRGCYTPAVDALQHEALALIKAEAGAVVTPPSTPPPTPTGHPILDVNLIEGGNYEAMSHAGYRLIVEQKAAHLAEIHAWCQRANGRKATEGELIMAREIRCVAERYRWVTPRGALMELWPGGAPK